MNLKKLFMSATMGTAITVLCSCAVTNVGEGLSNRYVYPNSDIRNLGNVSLKSKSFFNFIKPKHFKRNDLDLLIQETLQQEKGANILTDYKIKTITKPYPLFLYETYILIEGVAGDMRVGSKLLGR